jgi:penicillin-binding protein 1A
MIAGMFQAPGEYDPYVNSEKTNVRKNEVINLMLRHGYLTEEEASNAKKIRIEDIIKKQNTSINPYQGFIDTVVQEVIDRTGNNPYEVSMDIYSTMVKDKQDVINDFYNSHNFKDDKVQVGIGVIDNDTGAIIAVGAGRFKTSEMSLNYATQIKRHPGSTAKPIFDYGPGIEYNGWGTHTTFVDKPVRYTNGGIMHNVDNDYQGTLTLEQCLIRSRNTCALQAFQKVSNSKINNFVTSLGITPEYFGNSKYIHEAHSIGAFTGVSPVELASAYTAFGNGGYHTEPHSITKIVYKNADEDVTREFSFQKKRVMKETTAYMIAYMLKKATTSAATVKGTDVSVKTGTSSYDDKTLKKLGLSTKVVQDAWTVTFSPDYSIAIWYGYDKLTRSTYNTTTHAWSERTKIQREIVKNILERNSRYTKPSGIVYRNGGLAAKK